MLHNLLILCLFITCPCHFLPAPDRGTQASCDHSPNHLHPADTTECYADTLRVANHRCTISKGLWQDIYAISFYIIVFSIILEKNVCQHNAPVSRIGLFHFELSETCNTVFSIYLFYLQFVRKV